MARSYEEDFVRLLDLGRAMRYLPWPLKEAAGRWLGRRYTFLRANRARIVTSLQAALGVDVVAAGEIFDRIGLSTGVATQMVWQLPDISPRWLGRHIATTDAATDSALQTLRDEGGIILSHHSFHHNLLASVFKRWQLTTFPVANPPTAFSADDRLYQFTLYLNAATETNLNGGRFLYVNEGREFLQGLRGALQEKNVLLLFCDFNEVKPFNPVYPFFHAQLQPPSGVLRQVVRQIGEADRPIYFAGFHYAADGGYRLSLERLPAPVAAGDGSDETGGVMQNYLQALATYLRRHPAAWQAWEMLGGAG